MKILNLCYEFPPLGGGGGRAAYGLASELVRTGHQIDFVTMGFRDQPRRQRLNGIEVYRARCVRLHEYVCSPPELASYVAGALPLVRRLVGENRYDINHTHFIFPDGVLAYLLKQWFGLPYVITAHGSDVPGYNPDRFHLAHRLLAPIWRKVVKEADQIILPSDSIRSLFRRQEVQVSTTSIPYGMDEKKYQADGTRQPKVLVVTRMLERKGVQFVLDAFADWDSSYELHIVGDGPYLPALRQQAREQRVDAHFWGWLDNESPDLRALFETSAIFVLPSLMENFPVVLLEAMAAGLPIVTTAGTGCAEVVGETALLVPSEDPSAIRNALHDLMENPQLRGDLGQRARERLENEFSWTAMAERHLELYQRCTES